MAIQRLSHIGICVSDAERSKKFYQQVFGYEVVAAIKIGPEADALLGLKNSGFDAIYMQRPGEDTRIELLYFRSPGFEASQDIRAVNLTGITHLSFRTDDLLATVSQVKEFGGQFLDSTLTVIEKFHMKSCMVTDPDGTRIELLQAPGDPDSLPGQKPKQK